MKRGAVAAACIAFLGLCSIAVGIIDAPAEGEDGIILGRRPGYGPAAVSTVPNETAIVRRIWMPGLEDGYNPQGLAIAGDSILVAAYRSASPDVHRGPCRVFRIDPMTGGTTGQFDISPDGHAGGLAVSNDGRLYIVDTHALFVTDPTAASNHERGLRIIPLGPGLIGALAASGGAAIWLGTYREDGPGRLYRFTLDTLDRLSDGAALNASDRIAELAIPSHAQGAALDAAGRLWVARSDLRWGELDRVDLSSGRVERAYHAPAGIEGIAFDGAGRLWAVSEAGVRHYYQSWRALVLPFYPLVFAIDIDRLQ